MDSINVHCFCVLTVSSFACWPHQICHLSSWGSHSPPIPPPPRLVPVWPTLFVPSILFLFLNKEERAAFLILFYLPNSGFEYVRCA